MDNSEEQKHIQENNSFARIEPYTHPAGGWGALLSVARNLKRQDILGKGSITLLNINQPTGFDCPGCAWPEKKDAHAFNFCENGAKAVAFEATSKTVTPEYFAGHTVSWLSEQSDFFLEDLGRLTDPVRYDAATDKYVPISWDDAFKLIAQHLHALDNPDQAAFYTSGRASNEAAFLYQLFVRSFGTNNFPDCSNMCHETTSVGLLDSIGLGKGTVTLDDFDIADAIFSFGHNPGTNHPRMLGTLREVSKRGGNIIAINPIKERGLERFQDPQAPLEMMTNGSTPISRYYFQPKIGGDYALMLGMLKHLNEWDKKALASGKPSVFDRNFIAVNTVGFDEMIAEVERTEWADIHKHSGLSPEHLEKLSKLFLSQSALFSVGVWALPSTVTELLTYICWQIYCWRVVKLVDRVQDFVRFVGTVTCKATELWVLMNCLALNYSIALTVCSVLNHREKMGMVWLKPLKLWLKARSKSLLVWAETLRLRRQILHILKKRLENVI